jgi:hypothetical protein
MGAGFNNHPQRLLLRSTYALQKMRIQTGNRLVGSFKVKLGFNPGEPEKDENGKVKKLKIPKELMDDIQSKYENVSEKDDVATIVLKALHTDFKKITDGVVKSKVKPEYFINIQVDDSTDDEPVEFLNLGKREIPPIKKFRPNGIITNYTELCLVDQYLKLETDEAVHFRRMESVLTEFPIYNEFLSKVKGIGPAMAGVLVSELNIFRCNTPSAALWYSGYGVKTTSGAKNGLGEPLERGEGQCRKENHLIDVPYIDKNGKPAIRKSITFNPFLKTKLHILATSFIKVKNEKYSPIYYNYKHRLENSPAWADRSKAHIHAASLRYMLKFFLLDLWLKWRTLEGLPITQPYHVAKLGLDGHGVYSEYENYTPTVVDEYAIEKRKAA